MKTKTKTKISGSAALTGDYHPGGGVYCLSNRPKDLRRAVRAIVWCEPRAIRGVLDGTFVWVSFIPYAKGLKLEGRVGLALQKIGNRLVAIPNDGWAPVGRELIDLSLNARFEKRSAGQIVF